MRFVWARLRSAEGVLSALFCCDIARARRPPRAIREARPMTDVAIVGYAQSPPTSGVEETETQMLFPAVNEALDRAGLTRKEIGFTCSASCDYLSGAPFAFVQTLEVTG